MFVLPAAAHLGGVSPATVLYPQCISAASVAGWILKNASLLFPSLHPRFPHSQSAEKLQLTGGAGVCGLPAQMWFGICLLCAGAGSCPLAGPAESREDSRCQSSRDTGTVWQQSLTTWCWLPAASPSLTPGFGDTYFRWRDGWMDGLMDGTSWSEVPSHLPLGFQSLLNRFATQKRVFHQ